MRAGSITVIAVVVTALAAGCGSASNHNAAASRPTTTAVSSSDSEAVLRRAVRVALMANHRLAIRVLWQNVVPADATQSTRGPALVNLRKAAADRRRRGVRVRLVADDYRVLSLRLDPSYASATVVALGRQRVRPYRRDGRPLGHTVYLNERARIELRRLADTNRFVVWRVDLVR